MMLLKEKNMKRVLGFALVFVMLFGLAPNVVPKAQAAGAGDAPAPALYYDYPRLEYDYLQGDDTLDADGDYDIVDWDSPNPGESPDTIRWLAPWSDKDIYEKSACFLRTLVLYQIAEGDWPEGVPDGTTCYLTNPYTHTSVNPGPDNIPYSEPTYVYNTPSETATSSLKNIALTILPTLGPDGWHQGASPESLGYTSMHVWRCAIEVVTCCIYNDIILFDNASGYAYIPLQASGTVFVCTDIMQGTPYTAYKKIAHGYIDRCRTNSRQVNRAIVQILGYLDSYVHGYVTGQIIMDTSTSEQWTLKEKIANLEGVSCVPLGEWGISREFAEELGIPVGTSVDSGKYITISSLSSEEQNIIAMSLGWQKYWGQSMGTVVERAGNWVRAHKMAGTQSSWRHLAPIHVIERAPEPSGEPPLIILINGYIDVHKTTEDQAYNSSLSGHTFVVVDAASGSEAARGQTDINGFYEFTLPPGTYNVYEIRKDKYSISGDTWRQNGIVVEASQVANIYPTNTLVRGGVQWRKFDYDFNS